MKSLLLTAAALAVFVSVEDAQACSDDTAQALIAAAQAIACPTLLGAQPEDFPAIQDCRNRRGVLVTKAQQIACTKFTTPFQRALGPQEVERRQRAREDLDAQIEERRERAEKARDAQIEKRRQVAKEAAAPSVEEMSAAYAEELARERAAMGTYIYGPSCKPPERCAVDH
jgi:hypothetical protein